MRVMLLLSFLISSILSGCAFVDRHATGMRDQLLPNKCATETTRHASSYSTTSTYRCVGDACQDYGCKQ